MRFRQPLEPAGFIMSTFFFILKPVWRYIPFSRTNANHTHDPSIAGWMLRETGKGQKTEERFWRNITKHARTMLMYAIEKFSPEESTISERTRWGVSWSLVITDFPYKISVSAITVSYTFLIQCSTNNSRINIITSWQGKMYLYNSAHYVSWYINH